jgi:flagellar export protein FliJ
MKRYRFRLQTVLRVRRIEEALARQELGLANRSRRLADELAKEMQARYDALPRVYEPMNALQFRASREEAERLGEAVTASLLRVERAASNQQQAIERLTERSQRVRTLERLEANARAAWQVEMLRDDYRMIDDITTARAAAVVGQQDRGDAR